MVADGRWMIGDGWWPIIYDIYDNVLWYLSSSVSMHASSELVFDSIKTRTYWYNMQRIIEKRILLRNGHWYCRCHWILNEHWLCSPYFLCTGPSIPVWKSYIQKLNINTTINQEGYSLASWTIVTWSLFPRYIGWNVRKYTRVYRVWGFPAGQVLIFRSTINWTYAPIVLHIGTIGTTTHLLYGPIVQCIITVGHTSRKSDNSF